MKTGKMIVEITAYILIFAAGAFFGWILRNNGYRLLKHRSAVSEASLANEIEVSKRLKQELVTSAESLNKMTKEKSDLENIASERNIQLEAELSKISLRLAETETLLQSGQPVVHALKLKLIEANNTIARYKSKLANAGAAGGQARDQEDVTR